MTINKGWQPVGQAKESHLDSQAIPPVKDSPFYYIPNEANLSASGETLGPFIYGTTKNGVGFFKSINKSFEGVKVGYLVGPGGELHRHEIQRVWERGKGTRWIRNEGCCSEETGLTVGMMAECAIQERVLKTRVMTETVETLESSLEAAVGVKTQKRKGKGRGRNPQVLTEIYLSSERTLETVTDLVNSEKDRSND